MLKSTNWSMSVKTEKFQAEAEPSQKTEDLYERYEERKHYCFVYLQTFNFHQLGGKNR